MKILQAEWVLQPHVVIANGPSLGYELTRVVLLWHQEVSYLGEHACWKTGTIWITVTSPPLTVGRVGSLDISWRYQLEATGTIVWPIPQRVWGATWNHPARVKNNPRESKSRVDENKHE